MAVYANLLRPGLRGATRRNTSGTSWPARLQRRLESSKHRDTDKAAHAQGNTSPHPPPPQPPSEAGQASIPIPGPSWLYTSVRPLAAPFRVYSRIQSRRPYVTQLISSIIIYYCGDLSTQLIQRPGALSSSTAPPTDGHTGDGSKHDTSLSHFFSEQYSPGRSLRAMVIGCISSLPSYHWFMFLGRSFNVAQSAILGPRAAFVSSLSLKIVVNQIVFTPLFNSYFFGMHSLLAYPISTSPLLSSLQSITLPSWAMATEFATRFVEPDNWTGAKKRVLETVPISWVNSCKFWPVVTAFSFTFVAPQHRSVFAGVVAIGWQTYLGMVNQRAVEKEMKVRDGAVGAAV